MLSELKKKDFLTKDLYDALRWLFLGAVAWEASRSQPARYGHLCVLGMSTRFVQARALYEFFFDKSRKPDDARAGHFAPKWKEPKSPLYLKYMSAGKPVNKRMFHMVYERSLHAGGAGHDGPDHFKNQVVEITRDLLRVMRRFRGDVEATFRAEAEFALREALKEAQLNADQYGISNPLA